MSELEEKRAKELRRLVEKLTMARSSMGQAYTALIDADLWADKVSAPKVQSLYRSAERVMEDIDKLLVTLKGE